MQFTEREKKIAKTYRMIAYISIPILLISGVIFTYVTDFERSYPLGILLLFSGIFLLLFTLFLHLLLNSKEESTTTYRVYERTKVVLLAIVLFFFAGSRVLVSLSDIALGTKEVVLTEAKVKTIKEGLHKYGSTDVTYLIGRTKTGETIKIRIREYETESKTRTLLKTSDEVIVSYYKSLKTLYDIKAKD